MTDDPPAVIECIARGLVLRQDRVLLCRDVRGGHAYLPGGHVEPGESVAEGLRREFEEETGLSVCVGPPLLVWESRFLQRGVFKHEWTIVFHVELTGKVSSREDDISFEWVERDAVEDVGLRPEAVGRWLRDRAQVGGGMSWLSIDETG